MKTNFEMHSECHLYYHYATIHTSKSYDNINFITISKVFELFHKHFNEIMYFGSYNIYCHAICIAVLCSVIIHFLIWFNEFKRASIN